MSQPTSVTTIISNACPTYFRAWCNEAARPGSVGYISVGRQLADYLNSMGPYRDENGAGSSPWLREMERFQVILDRGEDDLAFHWFDEHLPRCMALIPAEERPAFLNGFRLALAEDGVRIALN